MNSREDVDGNAGMLVVDFSAEATSKFLKKHVGRARIPMFQRPFLEILRDSRPCAKISWLLVTFARRLWVDLAYHSEIMGVVGL